MNNSTKAGVGGFTQGFSNAFFPSLRQNEAENVRRQDQARRQEQAESMNALRDLQTRIAQENQAHAGNRRQAMGLLNSGQLQGDLGQWGRTSEEMQTKYGANPLQYLSPSEIQSQTPKLNLERIEMDGAEGPGIYLYNPDTGAVSARKIGGLVPDNPLAVVENNVGNQIDQRPKVGTPGTGYQRVWDEEKKTWRDEPIPGSKSSDEISQRAKTGGVAGAIAVRELDYVLNALGADPETGEIVREGSVMGPKGRTVFGNSVGGFVAAGTETGDFLRTVQSIKDTIAIGRLLEIKASGAGLGQVPQSQLEALANALGNIDVSSSDKLLAKNLADIRKIYSNVVETSINDANDHTFGTILRGVSENNPQIGKNADDAAEALIKKYRGK
jgi:hypothetical protein